MIYTSGTTGASKGALHGHRVLLGHQPGFQLSHDRFPRPGDRFWTPADWAWIGGLMNGLFSCWYHGQPIAGGAAGPLRPRVGRGHDPHGGDPQHIPPADRAPPHACRRVRLPHGSLRTVMSGGEVLGRETHEWAQEALGVSVNEIYGQTEANYVVGNCQELWPVRPGRWAAPIPGTTLRSRRARSSCGSPTRSRSSATGISQRRPQPRRPADSSVPATGGGATSEGYFWFEGRVDDVISSAGYRIGPEEVEECLTGHHAVALAAAIGVPDETRGEVVKAFVVLRDGYAPGHALAAEIREHVRTRLAAYEYPRQLEFVESLPLTVTGKIRRGELRRLEALRQSDSSG